MQAIVEFVSGSAGKTTDAAADSQVFDRIDLQVEVTQGTVAETAVVGDAIALGNRVARVVETFCSRTSVATEFVIDWNDRRHTESAQDGIFVARNTGAVVATLQDLKSMKVDFSVPEQMVNRVKVGQSVKFGLEETSLNLVGHIIGVDPKVDPQTRLVSVQAMFENNGDNSILPGRFVHVRIELPREENIVTVPQTAVITSLYGDYVYTIQEEAKGDQKQLIAKQVFVKVGRREGTESEIVSGLTPGQKIVIAGQNKIQSGAVITINNSIDVTATNR